MNENHLPERDSVECSCSAESDENIKFAATINEMVATDDAEGLRRLIANLRPDFNEMLADWEIGELARLALALRKTKG